MAASWNTAARFSFIFDADVSIKSKQLIEKRWELKWAANYEKGEREERDGEKRKREKGERRKRGVWMGFDNHEYTT